MREVALMGLFLGVPQTSSHLGLNPLLVLGWIRNLGLDPLFRDIINTLVEGVNAAGVDKIAGEFRLSQETLRRVIAFAKRERQRREQENVPSSVTSLRLTQDFSRPGLRRVCLILCSPAQCRRFSAANPPELCMQRSRLSRSSNAGLKNYQEEKWLEHSSYTPQPRWC